MSAGEPEPGRVDSTGTAGSPAEETQDGDTAGCTVNRRIEQQLFTLYRRTNSVHVHTSSGDHELERSTYGILCLLQDAGPQRLGAIAAAYHLDPSTVTRQAQAVVRLGLAAKRPDPEDGRAALLALTPEGESAIRGAREHRRGRLEEIMSSWTSEQREQFARGLERFNESVDQLATD